MARSDLIKAAYVKARSQTVASFGPGTVVFACYSKACAPPPVGKGGSGKEGGVRHWDVDWTGLKPVMISIAELKRTQYPDASKPKGKFNIDKMPPIKVLEQDDERRILDGHHRLDWAIKAGHTEIPALVTRNSKSHPIITAAEARGDSKPVSREEFQRLARIGQSQLDTMSANASPITGLDKHWDQVKADSYAEVTKPWGGATIDAHTGKALPQGANRFALTVKEKGSDTVSIPENATQAEFNAAMNQAKRQFKSILERESHHLGVFHDDDLGRIDIDPVLVVDKLRDVHTIGAATRAIGGAYNFSDGNGYWPPHVSEEG